MNTYIHPDNQKLLWTTIHSVPIIANLPNEFKTKWFKEIVKMFYEKNPHIRDKAMLQHVNKQTVQYMIQNAKTLLATQTPNPNPPSVGGITSEFTRYEMDSKKNTEWYNKAFAERQKEYETMHAKPLAPEVNFAIRMDDAPLSNMEELIEKYKQERENDMKPFPSPTPEIATATTATAQPPVPPPVPPQVPPQVPLSIMEELQQMKKEIQELRQEIELLKNNPTQPTQ